MAATLLGASDAGRTAFAKTLARRRFVLQVHLGADVDAGAPIPWPAGFDPDGLTREFGPWGKPHFVETPDIHYNVSHSAEAIAVAMASRPVGVDIERIGRYDPRIVARLFTTRERMFVESDPELTELRFCALWTRKEAHAKWSGEGGRALVRVRDVLVDRAFTTLSLGTHLVSVYC